ncbi:tyrosine-type recombinase/integrase [Aeoliella sp.]|uniref:tyrosine-type recombinase/integrase n=1 Tax=Aeoliella sp. TaxID=2795800 RepID=UPI003CCBBA77
MLENITTYVVKPNGRNIFQMRYLDPYTGKEVTRSTKCTKRKDAEKAAGVWQDELRRGVYVPTSKATWAEVVEHYKETVLAQLGDGTATTYFATFNKFETLAKPQRMADLTTNRVVRFVKDCREKGLSEATISRHLRTLKVLARWANKRGMLSRVPTFEIPKHVKGTKRMKGRPITLQEFNEMLLKVPKALEDEPKMKRGADTVRFFLKGLWCSGLRLSEALALRWDDAPGAIVVDRSGNHPLLRIPAEAQKSGKDQMLPMVPEFAKLLDTVPPEDRSGHVFDMPRDRHATGRFVSSIGKLAGVVVDSASGKFASAHDLRRAFGFRWSRKVMPAVLMELMRHAKIETTMAFYVGDDAQRTAAELWSMESGQPDRLPDHPEEVAEQTRKNPFE